MLCDHAADDDARQGDDHRARAHVGIIYRTVLTIDAARQRHQTVGEHQPQHFIVVGIFSHLRDQLRIVPRGAQQEARFCL